MSSHGNSSSLYGNTAAVDPTNHSTASSSSSTLFGCARVGGGSTSRWVAYAQQAVRSVWHIICAALPFPLIGDSNVLLFKRSGSSSHQPQQQQRSTPPPQRPQQVSAAGGTGFNANRIVTNRDFGALTRGATTLEDIIGSSFEGSALCVLIAHSELSTDSVRLIRELHDLLDHHHNTAALPPNDDDDNDERRSVAVNIDEQRYRNAWNTLAVVAHTYVLSLFSIEGSFIPALQTCAAPAVLVYAPVDGNLTRVGVLMGPITLHDVVKMVNDCQAKWAVSPHRWK